MLTPTLNPIGQTTVFLLKCYPDSVDNFAGSPENYFEGCPETAVVTLAPELHDRVSLLTSVVERLKVQSIVAATACVTFHAWDEDGVEIIGEELPTDNHRLHVTREGIWFSGCREVSRRRFRTPVVDVEQLNWGPPTEISVTTVAEAAEATQEAWMELVELVNKLDECREDKRREFVAKNKRIWQQYRNTIER